MNMKKRMLRALEAFGSEQPQTLKTVAVFADIPANRSSIYVVRLMREGLVEHLDFDARESDSARYRGERFVLTPLGRRALDLDGAEAVSLEPLPGESLVQFAMRCQPTSVWALAGARA